MMKIALIPNDFSMDLERVFKLCVDEDVKYVELAYMWGKSILGLSESELAEVEKLMKNYNLQTASIQTQIMKVFRPSVRLAKPSSKKMHRNFDYNISRIDTAINLAKRFNAKYIVSYSFFSLLSKIDEEGWDLLLKTYESFIPKLKENNITMVLECEGDTYLKDIDSYLRFFNHFDNSPHLKANLDLSNLLSTHEDFTKEDFDRIYPFVEYFHVKDKFRRKILWNKPSVFGEGNIPWKRVLPWFKEKKWSGFLSIEPHVHGKNKFDNGRQCVKNLKLLLKDLDIEFD